jgi:putative hemolysin
MIDPDPELSLPNALKPGADGPFKLNFSSKRLPPALVSYFTRGFERLLGFHKFNAFYHAMPPAAPENFSQAFLKAMGIRLQLEGAPLETIPKSGPLLVVANHPFGLVEGMTLDMLLLSARPDSTVMLVQFLQAVPEFAQRGLFVGQRDKRRQRKASLQGWREAMKWVGRGGALLVFPAGTVERLQWRSLKTEDPTWSPHVAALALRTGAKVLPIFVHGHNSWASRIIGALWPRLLELRLIAEANNKRGRSLRVTLGRVIEADEIAAFATDGEAIGFLRKETELLKI